jgi:formylglycine-generating enzyme required for sulfatase activity
MSGNAQEMTSSWWGNYSAIYKELEMGSSKQIVLRGGRAQRGVASTFQNCTRDAYGITSPVSYSNFIGFRFACDPIDED